MTYSTIQRLLCIGTLLLSMGCDGTDDSSETGDTTSFSTDSGSGVRDDSASSSDPGAIGDTDLGAEPAQTEYDGFEEQYILTADDDPVDICRIRYELHAVAEPMVPCSICEWDVVLEKRNPEVVVNIDNACENSELGLDAHKIESAVGERIAYGFAAESVGHANILMRYNPSAVRWEEFTVSNWDAMEARFRYKRRDGMCAYGASGESVQGICGISGEATVTSAAPDTDED